MKGATLKDVADEAKVSTATASRAINGLGSVTDLVKARVLDAANKLGYIPHGGARALAMSKFNTVGLILPDIHGEFFSEIIRGVDSTAREHGLHLLVSGAHGSMKETIEAVRAMSGRVDGLLVMTPFVETNELSAQLPKNLPLITISSDNHHFGRGSIMVDNFEGGRLAVRHLVEQGCQRLFHISGPLGNFEAQERMRGFFAEAKAQNIDYAHSLEGDFNEESGFKAMAEIIANRSTYPHLPDGIFVANDMMAVGALFALKENKLNAPSDVAIIGFDDVPIARFVTPSLSSIKVGIYELGRRGLKLLVEALADPQGGRTQMITIVPQLAIRESSLKKPT